MLSTGRLYRIPDRVLRRERMALQLARSYGVSLRLDLHVCVRLKPLRPASCLARSGVSALDQWLGTPCTDPDELTAVAAVLRPDSSRMPRRCAVANPANQCRSGSSIPCKPS